MGEEAMGPDLQTSGQLLETAAEALARRRELDGEIARLIDDPFDPTGPDRVRTAQVHADKAHRALARARGLYGPPPWETPGDEAEEFGGLGEEVLPTTTDTVEGAGPSHD